MSKLRVTTLHNGVVYDVGTKADDIPEAHSITADVWDGAAPKKGASDPDKGDGAFDPESGGTVDATKEYVGDDKERAAAMLSLEQKAEKPRSTLVEWLQGVTSAEDSSQD